MIVHDKFKNLINNVGVHTNQNGLKTYLKGDVLHLMKEARQIGIDEILEKLKSFTKVATVDYIIKEINKL